MKRVSLFITACLFFVVTLYTPASAGWTVMSLGPAAGVFYSRANGASGGEQVGCTEYTSGAFHASLWNGTTANPVDLNPSESSGSCANAISGGQEVGYADFGSGQWQAALWSGTAASCVDLNPSGVYESYAYGISGGQQVGSARVGNDPANNYAEVYHAGLWNGSAASWVDLNPSGSSGSCANATSGTQQVGYATIDNWNHAGLWSGTANSWVDLNPPGAYSSEAYGVAGSQQVGEADGHAGLWSGTANSWVDLSTGPNESRATAVCGRYQVGWADMGGQVEGIERYHASLWCGTAGSWVDLHALLPAVYNWPGYYCASQALGIDVSADGEIWVAGDVTTSSNRGEAVLWHYTPVPEPSSLLALLTGIGGLGGVIWRKRRA